MKFYWICLVASYSLNIMDLVLKKLKYIHLTINQQYICFHVIWNTEIEWLRQF